MSANIIRFENLLNRRVQKGEDGDFLSQIYEQAKVLIQSICDASEDVLKNKKKFDTQKVHYSQNVITFTGRRGTGKTSAMLTVAEMLKTKKIFEGTKEFCVLPYIDIATLSSKEDIFLMVLSAIQQEVKDYSKHENAYDIKKQSDIKKIGEEICKIVQHYYDLQEEISKSGKSAYNLMEQLSEKFNVRSDFLALIQNFSELVLSDKNGHVVICLDDIDMYAGNPAKIIQYIHQFFMIPNVLVLTTTNISRLSEAVQKGYYDSIATTKEQEKYHMHLASEQTDEYLRKIIPSDMRIVMPSWRKKEYREFYEINISFFQSDRDEEDCKVDRIAIRSEELSKKFPRLSKEFFEIAMSNWEWNEDAKPDESVLK